MCVFKVFRIANDFLVDERSSVSVGSPGGAGSHANVEVLSSPNAGLRWPLIAMRSKMVRRLMIGLT